MPKKEDLRELNIPELEAKISSLKEDIFNKKVAKSSGGLANPLAIRQVRREIARVKTILRERRGETK
ncbi:50S ribosomal protein L29 [bacterium]|nr:50S ribosomal protein L29 [bacterium]MBU4561622.1 50S ribosomal protein L29 [bacterium]MCG2676009.1 50S ribosomal protein L29 [bacterium]MCG2678041.1 50S ribosomal protein L29 [bacterium]